MLRVIVISAFLGVTLAARVPHSHLPFPMLDGRIVGGVDTTIEEHPYQLSLELNRGHWCGASLIRPNVALTAAHCTSGRQPSSFRVRAGTTVKNTGGELVDVLSICDHPNYYPYDYDVSVLLLSRELPIGASIQTISLQPANSEVEDGAVATVTGWGALSSGGSSPSILQEVQVPKVSEATCNANYPDRITDRMDCYGYTEGGKDACQGDSGGPLIVDGKQTGIVSWGTGCARPGKAGVYAKVSNKDITDHINSCIANF